MNISEINPKKWNDIFGSDFSPKKFQLQLGNLQSNQLKIFCKIEEKDIIFPKKIKSKKNINRISFSVIFSDIDNIKITPPFSGMGTIEINRNNSLQSVIKIEEKITFEIYSKHIQITDIKMDYFDIDNEGL